MDKNIKTGHAATMWLKCAASVCTATLLSTAVCAQGVTKPANIKATENNGYVTLSWNRVANADILLNEGFEGENIPDGWKVQTTNTFDKTFTWFCFPTPEQKDQAEEEGTEDELDTWRYSGKGSAVVSWDQIGVHEDGSPATQDEWLITPATAGAQYVDFYTYIDPTILEYGANDEFPDHYYVKVSHDGGTTWNILWDARYDSDGSEGWQHVSLYLGDPSEGAPIVAFHALGDQAEPTTGLYFTWAIDDVRLYKDANSTSDVPATTYNVLLDGDVIASGIKSTSYTDKSDKTPGEHIYGIQSVSGDQTAEAVNTKVEVHAPSLNAPTNVKAVAEYDDETGKYNVTLSWDAPEGDRTPAYYVCYANDAMFAGWVEPDEHSVEQTGVNRGVQYYAVKAVYENPDGESELVGDLVAMGTRNTPSELNVDLVDGNAKLSWKAPKQSEYTCGKYAIYRGNKFLADVDANTTAEYTDVDVPEGKYDYAIKAVYTDGVISLPVTASVNNGTKIYTLPFEEDFNGGLKPADWTVERVNSSMKSDYLWRFDNWYELPVNGGGFEGNFASMTSSVSPMVSMFAVLESPAIKAKAEDGETIVMEFDIDYSSVEAQVAQKSNAGLRYSYNQEDWADVCEEFDGYSAADLVEGETCKPQHMMLDVTRCFESGDAVYFGWYYEAKKAQHIAIDNVRIYAKSVTGISGLKTTDAPHDNALYNISGQRVNVNCGNAAPGVYIQGGKKIVVK